MNRLTMLCLVLTLVFAPWSKAQVEVQQKNVTGNCNVALGVVQSGKVEVQCGIHEAALKPLADKLNYLLKRNKLAQEQMKSLVESVNLLMSVVLEGNAKTLAEVRKSGQEQTTAMTKLFAEQTKVIEQQANRVIAQIPEGGAAAIEQFKQEAQTWRKQYKDLLAKWEQVQGDEQAGLAFKALQAGDLKRAGEILDSILAEQDKVADKAAPNHFRRGQIFELQFEPQQALVHYDAAYRFAPKNIEYAHAYALLLQNQHQFRKAARVYEENLEDLRERVQKNPEAYEPDLAKTLNNLGNLYSDTQRFAEAEQAYGEARDLCRKLALKNPEAYEPNLAATLNNLGILYRDTQRFAEAEQAFGEARDLYRKLAHKNPEAYEPNLATTLNNLGVLYRDTRRFAEAEKAYGEARDLYRKLALKNPRVFEKDVARVERLLAEIKDKR